MLFVCYWGIIKRTVWGNTGRLHNIMMWIIAILLFVILPVVAWIVNPLPVHLTKQFFNQAHNLPIAPAVDILAAYALYHLWRVLISKPQFVMFINTKLPHFNGVTNTTVLALLIYATPVLYQLGACLSISQYYLAYYSSISSLWGGKANVPSIMRVGRGEGMNKVWEYLDRKKEDAELLFDVGLEFEADLDERLLFSMNPPQESNFDIPGLWKNLQQAFANNGILLSNQARLLPKEIGHRWKISDRYGMYTVKKEENKLHVYDISLSADWYREFQNNGIYLPQPSTVEIKKANSRWLITGTQLHAGPRGITLCSVRKEKGRLNVYVTQYVVLYIRTVFIGYPQEDIMRYYVNETPEHVVRIGGIEYAWIYINKDKESFGKAIPRFLEGFLESRGCSPF